MTKKVNFYQKLHKEVTKGIFCPNFEKTLQAFTGETNFLEVFKGFIEGMSILLENIMKTLL